MPRVIPSQVVNVIERWFPLETQHNPNFSLNRQNTGQLMTIIDLVQQIPQELITVNDSDYMDLVIGINIIQGAFPSGRCENIRLKAYLVTVVLAHSH